MRWPKGLKVKFDKVEGGRVYFKLRASRFFLFKTILKVARQNIRKPALSLLIFLFAFYWLARRGIDAIS